MTDTATSDPEPNTNTRKRVIIFVSAMVVIAIALSVLLQFAQSNSKQTESFQAVQRVEISAQTGSVAVRAAEGNVVVDADSTFLTSQPSITQELNNEGLLLVRQSCPSFRLGICATNLEISVPAQVPVTVTTTSADVELTQMRSDVVVDSKSGAVEASEMFGNVDITSESGAVVLTALSSLDVQVRSDDGGIGVASQVAPSRLDVESTSGPINIEVPDDGDAYQAEVMTRSGRAVTDVQTSPTAVKQIRAVSDSGNIEVSGS